MKQIVSKDKTGRTMKCKEPLSDLIFFAEGSLQSERVADIEGHLTQCAVCSDFLVLLKKSLGTIEEEKIQPDDPFFFTRLMAHKQKKEQYTPVSLKRFIPAAVAIFLFIGGVLTGINIGKLYPATQYKSEEVLTQERGYLDELDQESIESFFLTVYEGEDE